MSEKNIGSNLVLSEHSMLDVANTVAVNRVGAWQFEQELKTHCAEIKRGEVELIPAAEVFADIRRKLQ